MASNVQNARQKLIDQNKQSKLVSASEKDMILRLKEKWRYLKPEDVYRDDEGENVNQIIVRELMLERSRSNLQGGNDRL